MRRHLILLLLALVTVLAACANGGGDPTVATAPAADDPATDDPATDATDADATDSDAAPAADAAGVQVQGGVGEAPQITLPDGPPPGELIVVDLVEGDGEVAPEGATVTTDYAGVSWLNDGELFDSSFERGEPATFPLDGVIAGWTQGIPGMKVGGRRLLVIPPDLAYGAQSPTPAIAPDDTLVFVIDLVGIQ